MATNAQHQAAWRQRQKLKFATAEEGAVRLRKKTEAEIAALRNELDRVKAGTKTNEPPPESATELAQAKAEMKSLRKELRMVRAQRTALRRALRKSKPWCGTCQSSDYTRLRLDTDAWSPPDPEWLERFSKIAGLLGSDNEAERNAAAYQIFKMLGAAKLRWSDIF
jgi:hypothetical protein